jgi:hypothetical protein
MKTLALHRTTLFPVRPLVGLFPFFLFLLSSTLCLATSYTWTGTTNTSWTTTTNWSPNGNPASTDYIIIQTGTNNLVLTGNKTIARFRINSGTMNLNGYTLTVTNQVLMYGGVVGAGKIIQNGTNTAYISSTDVNCKLDLTATTVTAYYSDFADSVKVKQTTTSGTIYWHGNRFYKHLHVENTSNGNMNIGNNPADTCFDGLTMSGRRIRFGYQHAGNLVVGDVVINSTGPSGTQIGVVTGNTNGGAHVDGNIYVNQTTDAQIFFSLAGQMTQSAGHFILDGTTGYQAGELKIQNLTQLGSGGGITLTHGAGTQTMMIEPDAELGSLNLDLDDVSIDQAVIKGNATVVAEHLSVTDNDFLAATAFNKTGSGNDFNGGNRFYGDLAITLSTNSDLHFAYSAPDTVFGSLTATNTVSNNLVLGEYDEFVLMGNLICDEQAGNIIIGGSYGGGFIIAGTTDQTLILDEANAPLSRNILMNKPSGRVYLSGTMDVDYRLTLTSGIIETLPTGLVSIRDNASVFWGSNDSYVEGKVKKIGNESFYFPVGRGGVYKPVQISAPSSTSDAFQAEYFTGNSSLIHDHASRDGSLNHMSENEYWVLTRENGSSTPTVVLLWDTITSCRMQTPLTEVHIAGWDGSNWDDLGNGGTLGTVDFGIIITAAAVTSFNMFTLAHDDVMDCCATPPTIAESGSLSPCEEDGSGIVTLSGSGGFNDYSWTLPTGDEVGTGGKLEVTDFQTYSVSREVCADTVSHVVSTPSALHLVVTPQFTPEGFNLSCYHAADGVVQVTLGGGTPPYIMDYTYNGLPFPPSFTQLGAGTYTLSVTDQTGCTVADTAYLTAPEQPLVLGFAGDDVTITAGEAVEIGATPIPTYSYFWYPETGLSDPNAANPVAYPTDTTMYILTVGTQDTCVSKDTVMVNVIPWELVELDSSDFVYIGDTIPSHRKHQVIAKFRSSLVKTDRVDNINIQKGGLDLFLTDSVISQIRLACYGQGNDNPSIMNGWAIKRVFSRLTSNDTVSISRLGESVRIPKFWTTFRLSIPETETASAFAVEMDSLDEVIYTHLNYVFTSMCTPEDSEDFVPDDSYFSSQVSLDPVYYEADKGINALQAWCIERGKPIPS